MLDYHIHTKFCGHALGEMEEYLIYALTQSLQEIGFSDHLPMIKHAQPKFAMEFKDLPIYVNEVQFLQRKYPAFKIKLGIEADYYTPNEEKELRELLCKYPFDYVYGSVHFIDDWAFDYEDTIEEWKKKDVNSVYRQYFKLLQQAACSNLFEIISHTDLVKKFGHRPTEDMSEQIEQTIRIYKETGVAVEINTSGLRRPVKEIYPSPQIIRLLKKYDIPIVFGSDAHSPEQVGKDFEFAKTMVKELDYTEVVIFEKRAIIGSYPI